jgi:FlaG/FlaF family flagellin (archaellin)
MRSHFVRNVVVWIVLIVGTWLLVAVLGVGLATLITAFVSGRF